MKKPAIFSDLTWIAEFLFYLNTAIWIFFGVASLIGMTGTGPGRTATVVVAILMFGNAAAMLVAGIGLRIRHRWSLYFGVLVLATNILLTFTDQIGFWDLITSMIDLILLVFLVYSRKQLMMQDAA